MSAGKYDLSIKQTESYHHEFEVLDESGAVVDFSTSTLIAEIRRNFGDVTPLAVITCGLNASGWPTIDLTSAQTTALPITTTPGICPYHWDLWAVQAGYREPILEGLVRVRGSATA